MHRQERKGNKICAKWEEQKRHDMHRERIRNMRPVTDSSEPFVLQMDHIRVNRKREQMLEERYREIDRDNRILLSKMSGIMKNGSQATTPRTMESTLGPQSLNRDNRKKELLRITKENQHILRRIQQAQPVYNHIEWEAQHRHQQNIVNNIGDYPRSLINKVVMDTPRSELVPLQAEAAEGSAGTALEYVPTTARSGVQDLKQSIEAPVEDQQVKRVFSEQCHITGTARDDSHKVEMTTDGRVLRILTEGRYRLELVVKEKVHRRLYRDTNGDYGAVAQRLRVAETGDGTRLQLEGDDDDLVPEKMPATARGAASSSPVAAVSSAPASARRVGDRGSAAKAAEGVRESTAAYQQMQQAYPSVPKSQSPASSPPPARNSPLASEPGSQAAAASGTRQMKPQAPAGAAPKKTGRPGGVQSRPKEAAAEELDADGMVAARNAAASDDEVTSQAATVYSAGCPDVPGSRGSAFACELELNLNQGGDPSVYLRGLTPDR